MLAIECWGTHIQADRSRHQSARGPPASDARRYEHTPVYRRTVLDCSSMVVVDRAGLRLPRIVLNRNLKVGCGWARLRISGPKNSTRPLPTFASAATTPFSRYCWPQDQPHLSGVFVSNH